MSLKEQMDKASKEVSNWPEWKRKWAKEMLEETAKPYVQHRRYPVTRDGTII